MEEGATKYTGPRWEKPANQVVFRIKTDTNGNLIYKARLVVKGYEQIPRVDFTKTLSLVAGDTTTRTVLATAIYLGWSCKAIDVEAAFLIADLDEDVYVKIPQGYNSGGNKGNVYKLLKAVYGIVQAPRCWSKTFTKSLISKDFEASKVDPVSSFSVRMEKVVLS